MVNSSAMDKNKQFGAVFGIISQDDEGKRLDAALAAFYPDMGLRARRRLWEWCRVLLDGRAAGPGAYARAGQTLEIIPLESASPGDDFLWKGVRVINSTDSFCAIFKPAGLPSAAVKGGRNHSVEEFVRDNWSRFGAGEPPLLCNRLDTPTSGLLLWAFGRDNVERFRVLETEGRVEKRYYALVRGAAPEELYMDSALDMAGREKTRVLDTPDADRARHSAAVRLALLERKGEEASLMDVTIRRGARHQIRAHLAAAGFPIIGDALYGFGGDMLFLHNYRVSFAGFSAEEAPAWPVPIPEASTR